MLLAHGNHDNWETTIDTSQQSSTLRQAIEIAVNLGLIFIILIWCFQIVRPFISFILWGGVIVGSKNLAGATEIEVLETPLSWSDIPAGPVEGGYFWLQGRESDDQGFKLVEVTRGSITEKAVAVGQIEPRLKFDVKSKIPGIVKRCAVEAEADNSLIRTARRLLEVQILRLQHRE